MKSDLRRRELWLFAGSGPCARVGVGVLLLLGLVSGVARAQEAQEEPLSQHPQMAQPQGSEPKIAVEVKSVSVPVTVRDRHGKIISNLTKADFVVEEDGRPQTINYFAREKDLPLRFGLLVDTSLSQRKVLEEERSASYSFLDQMLHSKDLAFVVHFDREVELLQDFTAERPKLQEALQSLQTPQFNASSGGQSGGGGQGGGMGGPGMAGGRRGGGGGRGGGSGRGGGTLLYDAVYLAGDELVGKQQGRKR
jgi:VWFA-related protein